MSVIRGKRTNITTRIFLDFPRAGRRAEVVGGGGRKTDASGKRTETWREKKKQKPKKKPTETQKFTVDRRIRYDDDRNNNSTNNARVHVMYYINNTER